MPFSSGNPVAVLVDAENVDAADARSAIAALSDRFAPLILHAFGDFRLPELQGWCDLLDEYDGQALQVTAAGAHRYGVQICLAMNVMDILHADRASAICIFCGDGDFSQLAVRVRKAGLPIYGFGTARCGLAMAPWFDAWHDIGGEEMQVTVEDAADRGTDDEDIAAAMDSIADNAVSEQFDTDTDIEAAVHSSHASRNGTAPPQSVGTESDKSAHIDFCDHDAMAEIEGNGRPAAKFVHDAPPIADMGQAGRLTEDATLLLSGFITDCLRRNGYALLSDVADAATATDILVPPDRKSGPDLYLKQLLEHDDRFEIKRLPMGDAESEFIRRV